jgi:hypothetical protein
MSYAPRDSVAVTLAYLEEDDDLVSEILSQYVMKPEVLELLLGVLSLVGLGRYGYEDVRDELYEIALDRAAR